MYLTTCGWFLLKVCDSSSQTGLRGPDDTSLEPSQIALCNGGVIVSPPVEGLLVVASLPLPHWHLEKNKTTQPLTYYIS